MSGEQARAFRLQRLLTVQARKRQMEEWHLAELRRTAAALEATSIEILQSLGDQSLLQGLFLEAKAATLRRNEVQIAANRIEQTGTEARVRDAQGIEKRLEQASEQASGHAVRAEERAALEHALDDYLTAARASFE